MKPVPAACIQYTVEHQGIFIFDRQTQKGEHILMPEAILWDFITRYPCLEDRYGQIGAILDMDLASVETFVQACVEKWKNKGYLV